MYLQLEKDSHTCGTVTLGNEKKIFLESALAPFFVCLFTFFCLVNKTEKLEVLPSVEHVQRSEKWW